jgi:putative endonuclease
MCRFLQIIYRITGSVTEKNKATHLQQGERWEQLACEYLINQGLTKVTHNYRCRYGELDLIMRDNNTLVIVEVRYRQSSRFGSAIESITPRKQAKIIAASQHYLSSNSILEPVRFDVIGVTGHERLIWIKNAFQT